MKRGIFILCAVTMLLLGTTAQASINGKNVILIHGLQFSAILNPILRYNEEKRENDVRSQGGPELNGIVEGRIFYNSAERLEQNTEYLVRQLKELEGSRICEDGCYFITASTGDLVARHILQNLQAFGIDSKKFWVIASFDLVGAGYGTELADVGVALFEQNPIHDAIKPVIEVFAPTEFWIAGMGYNIRPTKARETATQRMGIPHLRVAGRGSNLFAAITKPILKGGDDSVVPLHSACASTKREAIYSCSKRRQMDGKNVAWTSGASGIIDDHFPILMARDMHHTQDDYTGIAVPLNNNRTFNGTNNIGTRVSLDEKTRTTGRWFWKQTFTTIDKPSNQTLVGFFREEFNAEEAE